MKTFAFVIVVTIFCLALTALVQAHTISPAPQSGGITAIAVGLNSLFALSVRSRRRRRITMRY